MSAAAKELLKFIDAAPSPYHAVAECKSLLLATGFIELHEGEKWALARGGRYFYTKNFSTLIGFLVGSNFVSLACLLPRLLAAQFQ